MTVPRGTAGEFCTRGYSVMLGYWEEPDKTAEAIDARAGCTPATSRVMDDDGYLNITGRIKDMVIRGGENVYPREIEEFLYTHPDILDAQVVGVPDAKYGEELMAWIRLRPGAEPLTAEALRGYCQRQARPLQDSALRAPGRRLPDDGDRQGTQGADARGVRRDTRPADLLAAIQDRNPVWKQIFENSFENLFPNTALLLFSPCIARNRIWPPRISMSSANHS